MDDYRMAFFSCIYQSCAHGSLVSLIDMTRLIIKLRTLQKLAYNIIMALAGSDIERLFEGLWDLDVWVKPYMPIFSARLQFRLTQQKVHDLTISGRSSHIHRLMPIHIALCLITGVC